MEEQQNQDSPRRAAINRIVESREIIGRVLFYSGGIVGLVLIVLFLLNPFPDYHASGTHADLGGILALFMLYGFAIVSLVVSLIVAVWKRKAVLNFWMGIGCLVAGSRLLLVIGSFGEASLNFLSHVSLLGDIVLVVTFVGLVLLVYRWNAVMAFVNGIRAKQV